MKLNVKTTLFQEMVAKATKGASNNKMIPITSLMAIELSNGVLTLTTTDATNTLTIVHNGFDQDDFYVVVPVDVFSKLVAKTTTEYITLTLNNNSLEVKANGTYNIDLPLNEDGNLIKFPSYSFDTSAEKFTVALTNIKSLTTTNKAALASTMEIPCLTGYYCGNGEVITTDSYKVCHNKVNIFAKPALIPCELMDLLSIVTDEKIIVQRSGDNILFTTSNVIIHGTELEGIDEYPIEAIQSYLQTEFSSVCVLPKTALLNILDRLSLFIAPYDKNTLYMTFNNDGVVISSKRSNGTELIKYQSTNNFKPFTCCVDIELLTSQVSAQSAENVELWYGHEKAIKMVSGNVTQIVALLEDDRMADNG